MLQASLRLLDYMPRVVDLVSRFRSRVLEARESQRFAEQAVLLRYPTLAEAPVDAATLIQVRRPEDEGADLWNTTNRLQESLIQGGVSDHHRDKRGKLRSVRALRGIDSKVSLNKALWGVAEQMLQIDAPVGTEAVSLPA